MKKIFIATYGGGHVNIIKSILPELEDIDGTIEILALTIASASLKKDKIPHKTISDFLKYLPYKDKIIEYGKKAILGNHDDRSNIDIDDAIAYHGIGLYDLCLEYGEENGWQRFEEKGRKVFCPIKSMEIIVRAISPDLLIIPTGVRFEKALAKVANLNNIPVVYINDLPTVSGIDFDAKVCVMNDWAKEYAIKNTNINENDIIVTGQPVMEKNLEIDKYILSKYRDEIKKSFKNVVLFLGTPTLSIFPEVEETIKEIIKISKKHRDVNFIIRPHPGNLDNYGLDSEENVWITKEGELKYLLAVSDIVITQVSTGGLEAILLGKQVITVLNKTKPLFRLSDTGGAINIQNVNELEKTIFDCINEDSLVDKKKNNEHFNNKKNAAESIVNVIKGLI